MNSTLIPTTVKTNKLTKWAKKGVTFALMLLTLFWASRNNRRYIKTCEL